MRKPKNLVISRPALREGYTLALANALRLFNAAHAILLDYPDKALALAQIGQEELGKTLTLAAAVVLPADAEAWDWFWRGWRDHQLKAHRAYLYEMFSFIRLEVRTENGKIYEGGPLRPRISQEKEVGLYVDFDRTTSTFKAPQSDVLLEEAASRFGTLAYLCLIADQIRNAIEVSDSDFRFIAFGELAFRVCTDSLFQQEMAAELQKFRSTNERYEGFGRDMEMFLLAGEGALRSRSMTEKAPQP